MIKIECDIFHLCTEDHVIILGAEDGIAERLLIRADVI